MILKDIEKEILIYRDFNKSKNFSRFFKTGKGEYGEGDNITKKFQLKMSCIL
jgi:hypothetical protein